MSIERNFDIAMIAAMALREKQIQQNYRPIIAVHKWFARRPGTLFRGLLLAEFGDRPLDESFFATNDFPGIVIADPFMGGGTPLIEANRVGCDVKGFDINPMAAWIVREEIEHLDLKAYRSATDKLICDLDREIGAAYQTDCPLYGDPSPAYSRATMMRRAAKLGDRAACVVVAPFSARVGLSGGGLLVGD